MMMTMMVLMVVMMAANCIHRFRSECFTHTNPILHPRQLRHRTVKVGQQVCPELQFKSLSVGVGAMCISMPCSRGRHVLGFP